MRGLALGLALALAALAGGAAAEGYTPATNYVLRCSGCHDRDGSGKPAAGIPDFRDSVGSFAALPEGRHYLMHVPGVVNASLTDDEIAAVMNYVLEHFAGRSAAASSGPFSGAEVTRLRAQPVADVVEMRRVVVRDLNRRGLPAADYPWP